MTKKCACCNAAVRSPIKTANAVEFCSVECACYSGRFSIRDGAINSDQPIRQRPPKKPWYMDDELYLEYIALFGWHYEGGQYVLRDP